jgi:hypothetical protein
MPSLRPRIKNIKEGEEDVNCEIKSWELLVNDLEACVDNIEEDPKKKSYCLSFLEKNSVESFETSNVLSGHSTHH